LALLKWRDERQLEQLMADPLWHDPVMAGWWMWGQSSWIGSGWCDGNGAWVVGSDGRICKRDGKEPGVQRQIPHITDNGKGVNRPQAREPGVSEYHPMTMPELLRWMQFLSARLRHVRILNGDWKRATTGGATKTLPVRMSDGHAGIFLDPPYSTAAERAEVYAHEDFDVANDVREWCAEHGDDPKLRIVLAGYDVEHTGLEARGWTVVEWYRAGFLRGGMGNVGGSGNHQQKRERLWLSPHCLRADDAGAQMGLF